MRAKLDPVATSRIFIYNGKSFDYVLKDIDGHYYGNINSISSYSLNLNYSYSFEKQYNLTLKPGNIIFSFWLNINGEISRVSSNELQIGSIGLSFNEQGFTTHNKMSSKTILNIIATDPRVINFGAPESGFTEIVPGTS